MQNETNLSEMDNKSDFIYRVDKFIVPESGHDEFLDAVKKTHILLRKLPGFRQDFILEQISGLGVYNFVTIVEWDNNDFIVEAMQTVKLMQDRENFHPQEIMKRHDIKGDFSFSKSISF